MRAQSGAQSAKGAVIQSGLKSALPSSSQNELLVGIQVLGSSCDSVFADVTVMGVQKIRFCHAWFR